MLTALQLIKDELKTARENFSGTVIDITPESIHKDPGGKALPIGALYAHLLMSEDITTHKFLQGKPTLFETDFKDKTGASEIMPPMDQDWEHAHEKWAKTVQIDLLKLKEYEKAVYEKTNLYIDSLSESDLEKEVDLGAWGKKTIVYMLSEFIIGHTFSVTGEISAIKGVHGSKGYQF